MKKKVNGYEARSDKVVKVFLMLILVVASLMPLAVSANTTRSTKATVTVATTPTPTPFPTVQSSHEVSEPIQQQATPAVSWNS